MVSAETISRATFAYLDRAPRLKQPKADDHPERSPSNRLTTSAASSDHGTATRTPTIAARLAAGPTLGHAATKEMIRRTVDGGVDAADAALPQAGARVIASSDLQRGARTLLEKGPGEATFDGR